MPLTYLDIVNTAIAEAKLTLDPLTSSDFDDPPRTRLYNDIKRWVNVAYKDMLTRRKEQFSRVERTLISVWPRVQVAGLTYIPSVGDVLEGTTSGVRFEVKERKIAEDVENSADVEYTLGVEFDTSYAPGQYLQIGEQLDRISPTTGTAVGYIKGPGYIKMEEEVAGLSSILEDSVVLYVDGNYVGGVTLPVTPWSTTTPETSAVAWSAAYPTELYKTRQGTYRLSPYFNNVMKIGFSYVKAIPTLVEYDDVPVELPDDFHDMLVWRTVIEIADFNNDTRLYARANKRLESYLQWQDSDQLPTPFMDIYRFDGHTGAY